MRFGWRPPLVIPVIGGKKGEVAFVECYAHFFKTGSVTTLWDDLRFFLKSRRKNKSRNQVIEDILEGDFDWDSDGDSDERPATDRFKNFKRPPDCRNIPLEVSTYQKLSGKYKPKEIKNIVIDDYDFRSSSWLTRTKPATTNDAMRALIELANCKDDLRLLVLLRLYAKESWFDIINFS